MREALCLGTWAVGGQGRCISQTDGYLFIVCLFDPWQDGEAYFSANCPNSQFEGGVFWQVVHLVFLQLEYLGGYGTFLCLSTNVHCWPFLIFTCKLSLTKVLKALCLGRMDVLSPCFFQLNEHLFLSLVTKPLIVMGSGPNTHLVPQFLGSWLAPGTLLISPPRTTLPVTDHYSLPRGPPDVLCILAVGLLSAGTAL